MDSLTMLEIVMLVEQTLEVSIDNEELRDLRTIGDVKAYLNAKAMGEAPPKRSKTYRIEEIASLMPHREPFLFLESVSINEGKACLTKSLAMNIFLKDILKKTQFSCVHNDRSTWPIMRLLFAQRRI